MTTIPMTSTRPTIVRPKAVNGLFIAVGILAALVGLGWVGVHIQSAPFPPVPQPAASPKTVPLPTGLPAPVERFYHQIYGERIPVIRSAVISGHVVQPNRPLALAYATAPLD